MMQSSFLLPYTLKYGPRILEVGPDLSQESSKYWLSHGKNVTSVDISRTFNSMGLNHRCIKCDFLDFNNLDTFDLVYASHVMEHIQDTGLFLRKVKDALIPSGVLFVIVPPWKQEIVGGHVHVWNMGLLMYNLILSGFDVKQGRFLKQGYNLIGVVHPSQEELPKLNHDAGDIELLKDFFPFPVTQGFNGDLERWNWF